MTTPLVSELRGKEERKILRQIIYVEVSLCPVSISCLQRLVVRLTLLADALGHDLASRKQLSLANADQEIAGRSCSPSRRHVWSDNLLG